MTKLRDDTQPAMCYPHTRQYEQWKDFAEEMEYKSVSRFMVEMIEAGYKQMNISVENDEEATELRKQRNELKDELDDARQRIKELEEQLYHGERRAIIAFLCQQSNGASFAEIVQHLVNDAPARVAQHLEKMEGREVIVSEGMYYVEDSDNAGD